MKRRNHLTAFLLLLCLSVSLFSGCGNSKNSVVGFEDSIILKTDKATQVPHVSKVVLEWENIHALLLEEDGIYLYSGKKKTLLDENYQPTQLETAEDIPDARYGDYSIRDNLLYRGDEVMKHPLDQDDNLLGFWVLDGITYLLANRVLYDSQVVDVAISSEYLLYPLSDQVERGILLEGITGGLWSPVTDGSKNYWISGSELYRTDGLTVEHLGNLSLMGIDYQTAIELQPVADGLLLASNGLLFHLTPGENDVTITQPQGYGNIIIGTAGYASGQLTELVAKYNMYSPNKVEIKTYSDRTQLNLAILMGEVDMVGSDDAGLLLNYAKRQVLEPLENVIGPLLASGELEASILDACRFRDSTYMILNTYSIIGMLMPKVALEEAGGSFDTMTDLVKALDGLELQNFYSGWEKDIILNHFLFHGVASWVDDEKNSCNFEDENFIAMLKLINRFASDKDQVEANSVPGQTGLFSPYWEIIDVHYVGNLRLRYEIRGTENPFTRYGTEAALFASPTSGDAGLTIAPEYLYGVLTQSERKGSCADFLNWLLSEETQAIAVEQGYWGFPIRHNLLEAWVEETAQYSSENSQYSYEEAYDHYDDLFDMVAAADHFGSESHRAITDVIKEEALRYLNGEITPEQAAAYIQNRASLYLAEQG